MRRNVSRLPLVTLLAISAATAFGACGVSEEADEAAENAAINSGKADGSQYWITMYRSSHLAGGERTTLRFDITDGSGAPVAKFVEEHTKLFHLIVVSDDLSYFTHIHPTYRGNGVFSVSWTPPSFDDSYHLYAQFLPEGEPETLTAHLRLRVPGLQIKTPVPLADGGDTVMARDEMLMLERPAGGFKLGTQRVRVMIHNAATGQIVGDLEPFLGARAHLIAIKGNAAGAVFEHEHDMGAESPGGGHDGHGNTPAGFDRSGMVGFDVAFPSRGIYRLWVQYRRQGTDRTRFFTVRVN